MKLRAIGTAVPAARVDNATIAAWSGLATDFVRAKLGVVSRAFLEPDETGTRLAEAACRDLAARYPDFDLSKIGLLVLVTQNPDQRLPHGAALLQAALGLAKTTASFDIGLGCSGYVYGLATVRALMMAEGISDALLVTCDPYSRIMRRESRDVIGIFGDGAAATWLSAEAGARVGRGDYGTDGTGARHLCAAADAARAARTNLHAADSAMPAEGSLHMNGRAVFNFVQTTVPGSIRRCLERNGLAIDDVDLFVFHQASRFMLETLADQMNIPRDKVPIMLEETGNTVSSSIPMVLRGLGALAGKRVLVSGFGVGLSWATNLLDFREAA